MTFLLKSFVDSIIIAKFVGNKQRMDVSHLDSIVKVSIHAELIKEVNPLLFKSLGWERHDIFKAFT